MQAQASGKYDQHATGALVLRDNPSILDDIKAGIQAGHSYLSIAKATGLAPQTVASLAKGFIGIDFARAKVAMSQLFMSTAYDAVATFGEAVRDGRAKVDTLVLSACQAVDKALLLQGEANVIVAHTRATPALNEAAASLEAMLADEAPIALLADTAPTDKASLDRAAGIPAPPLPGGGGGAEG